MVEYHVADDLVQVIYHDSNQKTNLKLLKQNLIKILVIGFIVLF